MKFFEEKEYTAEERKELIRSFKTSDESLDRFCEQNGISVPSFICWMHKKKSKKKEIKDKKPQAMTGLSFVKLPVTIPTTYCSVEPVKNSPSIPITLRTEQWSIELNEGFSSIALSQIVKVLEA